MGLSKQKTSKHCVAVNRNNLGRGEHYTKCPSGYEVTGAASFGQGGNPQHTHSIVSDRRNHQNQAQCSFTGGKNICQAQCCK